MLDPYAGPLSRRKRRAYVSPVASLRRLFRLPRHLGLSRPIAASLSLPVSPPRRPSLPRCLAVPCRPLPSLAPLPASLAAQIPRPLASIPAPSLAVLLPRRLSPSLDPLPRRRPRPPTPSPPDSLVVSPSSPFPSPSPSSVSPTPSPSRSNSLAVSPQLPRLPCPPPSPASLLSLTLALALRLFLGRSPTALPSFPPPPPPSLRASTSLQLPHPLDPTPVPSLAMIPSRPPPTAQQ